MGSTAGWPSPPPPRRPGAARGGAWSLFRRLPIAFQVVAWLLLWPLVIALLLRSGKPSRVRTLAAAALLLAVTPAWGIAIVDSARLGPDPVVVPGVTTDVGLSGTPAERSADDLAGDEHGPPAAPESERSAPRAHPADPPPGETWTVTDVIDGDTVDVAAPEGDLERVRLIGIDTPERGECGYAEASEALAALVLSREVTLSAGAVDDRDRYQRLLRYLDVGGGDAGLALIEDGLAVARYDSRDGYGRHPREDTYVAADEATPHRCSESLPRPQAEPQPQPQPAQPQAGTSAGPGSGPGGAWSSCGEARAAGAAPVHRGDPGYGNHLDGDGDGVGCE